MPGVIVANVPSDVTDARKSIDVPAGIMTGVTAAVCIVLATVPRVAAAKDVPS